MALCTTDQLLESSSVAAPVAVERLNVEASRYSSALPVGLSRMQSNTATTQPDAVASGEELSSQGIDNDDETSNTSGPSNPSPALEPQSASSQQADAPSGPVDMNVALDLFHFFTGVKPA
ncbi:hypothetical protein V8E52_010095 [Russula decolorans]